MIKNGFVKVNGETIKKPSFDVKFADKIEIYPPKLKKAIIPPDNSISAGYLKLQYIHEKTGLLSKADIVLDIGSSACGFVNYCAERVGFVYGIEISPEFLQYISRANQRENVEVILGNAGNFDFSRFVRRGRAPDTVLIDLSVEPAFSLGILRKIINIFQKNLKILLVLKGRYNKTSVKILIHQFFRNDLGILEIEHIIPGYRGKREVYIILRYIKTGDVSDRYQRNSI